MSMEKHAYLIIAHKCDFTFLTLLSMLDHPYNDIFIHMDKKNKSYNEQEIESLAKKSKIYHSKRIKVTWGAYSQVAAELLLLELAASKGKYQYYHLISGEDLPIKTQDYIHEAFNRINGQECVDVITDEEAVRVRVRQYHLLQQKVGNKKNFLNKINKGLVFLQRIIGIRRSRKVNFYKGTNWFSITDAFARYVVSQKKWIKKVFKLSLCADELFLQTLIMNSDFKNSIHERDPEVGVLFRLIDWKRGSPYAFRFEDLEEIKNSKRLFVRKIVDQYSHDLTVKIKELYSK